MNTSSEGIALIKSFEGLRLVPYLDCVGVKTIGYGHAFLNGETAPNRITEAQADELLLKDLRGFEIGISALVSTPIKQCQFDALVSFAFNLGLRNLKNSTLLHLVNEKDFSGAANEFPKWDMAGGVHIPGLLKRRLAEKELFERW